MVEAPTPTRTVQSQMSADPDMSPLIGEQSPQKNEGKQSQGGLSQSDASQQQSASSVSYIERKSSLAPGELIPAYKHSSLKIPMSRIDRRGNEIGVVGLDGKKCRLTFIDTIEKKSLCQVHCVESYKKYNAEDPMQGDTPCCSIF